MAPAAAAALLSLLAALVAASSAAATVSSAASAAECERPLDIVFCLDTSGSITVANWPLVLAFVRDVASAFDFGAARVGVVTFDTAPAVLHVALGRDASFDSFAQDLLANGSSWFTGGSTDTTSGLLLAQAELVARGRSADVGAAHLMIVVTDGQSTRGAAPGIAAALARENGTTISVITIGPSSAFKPGEVESIVGEENLGLIFPIGSWAGVDNDTGILANITLAACGAPVQPADEANITSQLGCNATFPVVTVVNISRPLTIVASISAGSIRVCHSYAVRAPSALDAPGLTVCSVVGRGSTHISTTTAYPAANASDPAQAAAGGRLALFIAAEAITDPTFGTNDTSCGGNFTLETYYCRTRIATNVTAATNASSLSINTTTIGDPGAPACTECPQGAAFLSSDASSPLFGICAASCAGAATFIDVNVETGLSTCLPCDSSCAACVAKGGARACTACSMAQTQSRRLLPNAVDPALNSPYWAAIGGPVSSDVASPGAEQIVPDAAALTGGAIAGRCIADCPAGYVTTAQGCAGTVPEFVAALPAGLVLVTVGLPLAVVGPAPADCRAFWLAGPAAPIAGALAAAFGVPPAAVFLRACLDADANTQWVWTYTSSGSVSAATNTSAPAATTALQEATLSGCGNVSTSATFALLLGVARPGSSTSNLARALALSDLSSSVPELQQRAADAMRLLKSGLAAGLLNAAPYPLTQNCSDEPASAATVLAYCIQPDAAEAVPNAASLLGRSSATFCDVVRPPPPSAIGIGSANLGAAAAVAVPVALLALCCAGSCFAYARWRARRVRLVELHKRRRRMSVAPMSGEDVERALASLGTVGASREHSLSFVGGRNEFGEKLAAAAAAAAAASSSRALARKGFAPVMLGPVDGAGGLGHEDGTRDALAEELQHAEKPAPEAAGSVAIAAAPVAAPPEPEPALMEIAEEPPAPALSPQPPAQQPAEPAPPTLPAVVVLNPLAAAATKGSDAAADWGEAEAVAPARAPAMSVAQQLFEFVAPGSISLGMGLSGEPKDEPPPAPPSATAPMATKAAPASSTFDVGKITTRREVVARQIVQLRRVENVKGDVVRAQSTFTAVSGRSLVVEEREGGKRGFRGV